MKLLIIFALIGTAASIGFGLGRTQSAGAKGQLVCDGKPAANVKVKLYDDDRGIDTDDLMASGKTDGSGHFDLQGYTHEFTTIDPKINIYHDCNDGLTPCQRKLSIYIPDKYVSSGEHPERYFDAGIIELEGKFKGEERDWSGPCQRKLTVYVPDKYVSSGEHPKEIYDAGIIELAGKFKGEERDCIN